MKNGWPDKQIFWDYDLSRTDLSNPEVKRWYLTRKLNFGNFFNIRKSDLKEYLPMLDIDPSLKELLTNFLQSHV